MQRGREPARPAFPYQRVLEALRQDVLALAPGSAAPSESELAARHGVSRMTARNAVLVLRQEGLLYVVRGRGVYVARRKLDLHGTTAPLGFTEMARQHGLTPSSRLLRFDRGEADSALAGRLGVEAGAAGRTMARLFRIAAADPVLIARRVVYGKQGKPVEWTLGTYRADRYRATYRTGAAPPPGTDPT